MASELAALASFKNTVEVHDFKTGIDQIYKRLERSGFPSLKPLLPLYLRLKGRPYLLDDYFPFEPLFSTHMPDATLIKSGRQVSKSTSLAAQGVIMASIIPYFNTLYVTPLFEMIRRFSHNYVREFVDQSPVKRLLVNPTSVQNVLQRQFISGSNMYFSFAFLNADRTRGLNCSKVVIDECLCEGTMVDTPFGPRPVETFQPGDSIYSFDSEGNIHEDTVETCSDRGTRDCYRFEFETGEVVEATSDSFIATEVGWKRVQSLITESYANANATRDDAGRRVYVHEKSKSTVLKPTRLETANLQLPKIPGITRVRTHTSQEEEERRLREMVKCLRDTDSSSLLPYRCFVSGFQWQEAGDPGMAGSTDLGGDSVVVHGRRITSKQGSRVSHRRIHQRRSRASERLVQGSGVLRKARQGKVQAQPGQKLLDPSAKHQKHLQAGKADQGVHLPGDGIQDRIAEARYQLGLPLVPGDVYRHSSGASRISRKRQTQTLLREEGVQVHQTDDATPRTTRTPRGSRNGESKVKGTLPKGHRRIQSISQGSDSPVAGQKQGRVQCETQSSKARTCATTQGQHDLGLSALWPQGTARREGSKNQVLSGLSSDRDAGDQTKVRLKPSALIKITHVGKRKVYDLEVRKNQTFFAGGVAVHNCQDVSYDLLQIIFEVLAGSLHEIKQFTGTPKSFDNTMERLWRNTSQAEWFIKCDKGGCNYWNIPSIQFDLLDMIGKKWQDVGPNNPGIVCAKCRTPLRARAGRYVHAHRDKRWKFDGYHVPQIIMPIHNENPKKWATLLNKMNGAYGTTFTTFLNEVCGESWDEGSKILTESDLKKASVLPWRNDRTEALRKYNKNKYLKVIAAIDWGGGGGRLKMSKGSGDDARERTSFTVVAVLGLCGDGKIDVIYSTRSLRSHDFGYEAKLIMDICRDFQCEFLVHDYNGSGSAREWILMNAGVAPEKIIPVAYHTSRKNLLIEYGPVPGRDRGYISFDKTQSLMYTMQAVKAGLIRFYEYDFINEEQTGLTCDFLALIEEKIESRPGTDTYYITRIPDRPDDFAQAVNIGTNFLYAKVLGQWPDLTEGFDVMMERYTSPLTTPVNQNLHMPDYNY